MAPGDLLRSRPGKVWAEWHRNKTPDDRFRTLLGQVRDDAAAVCQQPVTDDYFLEPVRRQRLDELADWSHRLADRRLRRLVTEVVESADECWAKTKSPEISTADPRWSAWQFTAARDWLSASKAALDRLAVLEQRRDRAESLATTAAP
ncbi:MAG TPA: hypothetical protein VKB55_16105 [Nocardioidaceae bacterium]|nr:hypothetical protein [Nocardioidaceae bacterium]